MVIQLCFSFFTKFTTCGLLLGSQRLRTNHRACRTSSAPSPLRRLLPCDDGMEIGPYSQHQTYWEEIYIYHLAMTNSLPWKDPPFLLGKPSISMGRLIDSYPICSMYGIFTYIWVIFRANVGKYSSTMEHMGI